MLRKETEGVNKASSGGGYIFKIGIGNGGIIFSENILRASVLKLYTFLKTTDPAGTYQTIGPQSRVREQIK